MDPKNNPNDQASNANKEHDPEKGATIIDQQANAARDDAGKPPLPVDASHDLHSEDAAKAQAAVEPVADPAPPTPAANPASAKQISAGLVQVAGVFSGFGEPNADGKSEGTFTVHILRQPNDSRSEQAILYAAIQDLWLSFRQ